MPGMSEEPIEPVELAQLLSSHHVPGFSEAQQWLLVARLWGGEWPCLAELMHSTPDTLRRQFSGTVDVIVKPFGLARHESVAAHWLDFHIDCDRECLPHAKMRIENGIVFRIG